MSDVLTFGEALATMRIGSALFPSEMVTISVAGAESNVAIGLARLGHSVSWVGRCGRDECGALIGRALRGEGVDCHVIEDDSFTGILVHRERLPGVVTVDYHRRDSAGSHLTADDVVARLESGDPPRYLHVTGVTPALSRVTTETTHAAIDAAKRAGVTVTVDVNFRSRLWTVDEARPVLTEIARRSNVVIASEDELPVLEVGVDDLLAGGVEMVVVKRGSDGAVAHTSDGGRIDVAARNVVAVDSVGAGDAFCAGLLSGFVDGLDLSAALDRAVVLGAFAVSSQGDWEGLPSRRELLLLELSKGDVQR